MERLETVFFPILGIGFGIAGHEASAAALGGHGGDVVPGDGEEGAVAGGFQTVVFSSFRVGVNFLTADHPPFAEAENGSRPDGFPFRGIGLLAALSFSHMQVQGEAVFHRLDSRIHRGRIYGGARGYDTRQAAGSFRLRGQRAQGDVGQEPYQDGRAAS